MAASGYHGASRKSIKGAASSAESGFRTRQPNAVVCQQNTGDV
jgi:hypothetical protein